MALADDLLALQTLSDTAGAYTTGTAANVALITQANTVQAELSAGVLQAEAGLSGIPIADPNSLLTAAQNAQYLAGAVATQAWITRLQTVLSRP